MTIELSVALSAEQHKKLWEKYAYKGEGFQSGVPFKIPVSVADDLIKQNPPLERTQDFCGNPLKQVSHQTKVKTWKDSEASEKSFGFCTIENSSAQYMLKISAPNHVTDYYIGSYLGGCSRS